MARAKVSFLVNAGKIILCLAGLYGMLNLHAPKSLSLFLLSSMPPLLSRFFSLSSLGLGAFFLVALKVYGFKVGVTYGLPSMCAVLVWKVFFHPLPSMTEEARFSLFKHERLLQMLLFFVLPLSAILAFVVHPVGNQAAAYVLYWFIPGAVFVLRRKLSGAWYISAGALASTFVCHAVGSILWIYTLPSNPSYWIALIPVVFIERIRISLAMAGMYFVSKLVEKSLSKQHYYFKVHARERCISSYRRYTATLIQ